MNVTLVPVQIDVFDAAIEIEGTTEETTEIVIVFELAVLADKQLAFEVNTQLTCDPFVKAEFEYVELFVPTFAPFNFHW